MPNGNGNEGDWDYDPTMAVHPSRIAAPSPKRIVEAIQKADEAFWAAVAEAFPEATAGDVDPGAIMEWEEATFKAVVDWLSFNHPARPDYKALFDKVVEHYTGG